MLATTISKLHNLGISIILERSLMFIWDAYRGCQFTKILHIKCYSRTPVFCVVWMEQNIHLFKISFCYNKFQLNICFFKFSGKAFKKIYQSKKAKGKKKWKPYPVDKKPQHFYLNLSRTIFYVLIVTFTSFAFPTKRKTTSYSWLIKEASMVTPFFCCFFFYILWYNHAYKHKTIGI